MTLDAPPLLTRQRSSPNSLESSPSNAPFKKTLRIKPTHAMPNEPGNDAYLASAQAMIEAILPDSVRLEMESDISLDEMKATFFSLSRQLPLFQYSMLPDASGIILKILCPSEHTVGIARYISDLFSCWLVPGKKLITIAQLGIKFTFVCCPEKQFFFRQTFFCFSQPDDLPKALANLPKLLGEAKLNILAVYQARAISSMNSLSDEQRNRLIKEQLHSLFTAPAKEINPSIYDQMQHFLLSMAKEEKLREVNRNIEFLRKERPQNFGRDIFYEMTGFTAHFRDQFPLIRNPRHVSRVIAMHYLFKKALLLAVEKEPSERHLSFKLLKTALIGSQPVTGILIGMNFLKETEIFDSRHFLNAVQSCLPHVLGVNDSFIMDRRDEKVRIFYLEVQREDHQPLSIPEVRLLRQRLPDLLKRRVENVLHPVFMPRNEEEVLRTIVILSKQIKHLRDLPHLTIHHERQTDTEIIFLVVMVRVLKEQDLSFKELLRQTSGCSLRIVLDEIRSAGLLKRRYAKEAVVFRVFLDKSVFIRKDYSLNLKGARKKISTELRYLLGEVRDYNGGMIYKQDEALEHLRKAIGPIAQHNEILVENFFHSLRPGIMQTVHPPEVLNTLFKQLLEVMNTDLMDKGFILKTEAKPKFFFAMLAAAAPNFREEVMTAIAKLKIPSYDLTSSFLIVQESAIFGFIYRTDDLERRSQFQQVLLSAMLQWKSNFLCEVNTNMPGK